LKFGDERPTGEGKTRPDALANLFSKLKDVLSPEDKAEVKRIIES
jgi:hypothetical protein